MDARTASRGPFAGESPVSTLGVALLLALASCGPPPAQGVPPTSATKRPWDPALGTIPVRGRAVFRGEAPVAHELDLRSEAWCAARHDEPPRDASSLVDEQGGLANVFVFVERGLEGYRFAPPGSVVRLEQVDCVFRPRVLGVRAGQTLAVGNDDGVTHNVHVLAERNAGSNQAQVAGGQDLELVFSRPETMVHVRCDLHGWMRAEVGVVEHPFFAVTARDGSFELGVLPPGTYRLAAWHERWGELRQELVLEGTTAVAVELVFPAP